VTSALVIYGAALRAAATGTNRPMHLVDRAGRRLRAERADAWLATARPGDRGLLDRCAGPTLDVGCGPGRLVAALGAGGRIALGVDVSAEAVRQARRRGANALHRCVFGPLPGEGRWSHILLADGNIGIGGDPTQLLRRCASLLRSGGDVLVELDPPGAPSWSAWIALTDGRRTSAPFRWAAVPVDDLARHAAGLQTAESWTEGGRWFARLVRA
jgi:SAM-dependent methyltransferase